MLPVARKVSVAVTAAESDDSVGAADGAEHSGLFEALAGHGFASRLNDARTNEEMLAAELVVTHAPGVGFKVSGHSADLFGQLRTR